MSEGAEKLPKHHPVRDDVADNIRKHRVWERTGTPYTINRSAAEYIKLLGGVKHLFDYVRGLSVHTVLDIGAGTTRAINELEKTKYGDGLIFYATVLRNRDEARANLAQERVHIATAETLRGIQDASIGCVLAVYSISYSKHPDLVVESIDRVLVPGGVLKISGASDIFEKYLDLLRLKGYDVADDQIWGAFAGILAIKPGSTSGTTASQLFVADKNTYSNQQSEL